MVVASQLKQLSGVESHRLGSPGIAPNVHCSQTSGTHWSGGVEAVHAIIPPVPPPTPAPPAPLPPVALPPTPAPPTPVPPTPLPPTPLVPPVPTLPPTPLSPVPIAPPTPTFPPVPTSPPTPLVPPAPLPPVEVLPPIPLPPMPVPPDPVPPVAPPAPAPPAPGAPPAAVPPCPLVLASGTAATHAMDMVPLLVQVPSLTARVRTPTPGVTHVNSVRAAVFAPKLPTIGFCDQLNVTSSPSRSR